MARVRQLGLVVLHPYGDSLTYDLGIEQSGRLLRVQVKSTTFQRGETYELNLTGPGGRRYKKGDLDMFAVYVAPVDVWYILPFGVMERRGTSLQLTPGRAAEKYAEYLEAWGLLRGWWK
jgi:PD-(D/E)XK nuclease superfamily protein